jgi:hypothetical protein
MNPDHFVLKKRAKRTEICDDEWHDLENIAWNEYSRLKALLSGTVDNHFADPITYRILFCRWRENPDRYAEHPSVSDGALKNILVAELRWMDYQDEYADGQRLALQAGRSIYDFLNQGVPIWKPKMWHRNSGRMFRPVNTLIRRRMKASGYGCEMCHRNESLDTHHLHYRSFDYEMPEDVMYLCRGCHSHRHMIYGYPNDVSWTDPA